MKLIVFPLSILVLFSLLSVTGLGDTAWGAPDFQTGKTDPAATYLYYSETNVSICDIHGVAVNAGDDGHVELNAHTWLGTESEMAFWVNSTADYTLWYVNGNQVLAKDFGTVVSAKSTFFSIGGSLGMLAIVAIIMAVAVVAGLRVFGTGTSEESVSAIVKGTAFMGIWMVFSVMALNLITAANDLFLPVIYFVLTTIYTLGIINQIGHPGDD